MLEYVEMVVRDTQNPVWPQIFNFSFVSGVLEESHYVKPEPSPYILDTSNTQPIATKTFPDIAKYPPGGQNHPWLRTPTLC